MKNSPLSRWLLSTLLLLTFTLSACGDGSEDEGDEAEERSSELLSEDEEAETEAEHENAGTDED